MWWHWTQAGCCGRLSTHCGRCPGASYCWPPRWPSSGSLSSGPSSAPEPLRCSAISPGGYRLDHPTALAAHDDHLWVANEAGNSVTEINASAGALIRVLAGRQYGFRDPTGLTVVGHTAWVTSMGSNSVTRLQLR